MPSIMSLSGGETVIVAMDASKNSKGSMEALEWTIKNVVRPRDTIIVLGVLYELCNRKNINSSCFPFKFLTGIGMSGIWERLEFAGQGDVNPREIEEEFEERRIKYQTSLQPLYRLCIRKEVKLDVKLAAGFCVAELTVEEAQNSNAHWVILDSHFKKEKMYIFGHGSCNVALIKGKDIATIMVHKATHPWTSTRNNDQVVDFSVDKFESTNDYTEGELSADDLYLVPPQSPCWYPLSWRSGFPRAFSQDELEMITKGFSDDNLVSNEDGIKQYLGLLQETPIIVSCFQENDKQFLSILKILTRVCHRNITNLVGYCCNGNSSAFLLFDYLCKGSAAMNLQCDEYAKKLGWKARWCIAQEIGGSLRYLHKECTDGPIVHNSVSSSNIYFSHGCSSLLGNFKHAKWLKDEDFPAECLNQEKEECLFADVHDYGVFLLELITGKIACNFEEEMEGQTLIEWGLPLLEKGLLSQLMDSRLAESGDCWMVHHMAHAALHCLKIDSVQKLSITEAISIVRGDTRLTCNHWNFGKHPADCSSPSEKLAID